MHSKGLGVSGIDISWLRCRMKYEQGCVLPSIMDDHTFPLFGTFNYQVWQIHRQI